MAAGLESNSRLEMNFLRVLQSVRILHHLRNLDPGPDLLSRPIYDQDFPSQCFFLW